jgi:CheY-like chemotaxis protein
MAKRILLVENEGFMGEYLAQVLSSVGYEVGRAWNELEAWNLVAGKPPRWDLILCDMSLTRESSGLDLLRSLHSLPPGAGRTAFAFVSARRRFDFLENSARLGADGYLIKPVEPARLLREVDALVSGRGHAPGGQVRLLSINEKGFRIALPFGALSGAPVQLYNIILERFRTVPPRLRFLEAEHDPLDPLSYLVAGDFLGAPHEVSDLCHAWRERGAHGNCV